MGFSPTAPASPPVIAHAVAALIGDRLNGVVVDPFCGAGEFLWAALDRAVDEERSVELLGRDITEETVGVTRSIASTAPRSVRVERADAFSVPVPDADVVISAPPLGLRLAAPYQLLDGRLTKSGDLAAIDVCVRALKPGGRAVLQISPGVTFRGGPDASYREFLANNYRVAALIGCPAGSFFGVRTTSVLIVIDRLDPGETIVMQLGEDWEAQLSANGPALKAAVAHVDEIRGSAV